MQHAITPRSSWTRIGVPLLAGLFVAYLDRTNLSVSLPAVSQDMSFAGPHFADTSSWVLTIFLIGYALSNILGGIFAQRFDPKTIVTACFALWSVATIVVGFTDSVAVLLVCRFILGAAEGVYWPQQSRFAKTWFAPGDRTRANGLVQYYGQYLALALGFLILTPLYDAFGWRVLFFITGGLGLFIMVPLYLVLLRPQTEAPYPDLPEPLAAPPRLTLAALGGAPFLLLLFSYIVQGMLFWGITLWIPLAVHALGFTGWGQAVASSLPFAAAVVFAIPLSRISDRTRQRVLIATLGLLIPGVMMVGLPLVGSPVAKLALITIALGYYAGSYTPNIWSILQATVEPHAIGPAAGIINGLGAGGGGGTIAGFLVGRLYQSTGSYLTGFMVLGGLVILGGIALFAYGRLRPALQPSGSA